MVHYFNYWTCRVRVDIEQRLLIDLKVALLDLVVIVTCKKGRKSNGKERIVQIPQPRHPTKKRSPTHVIPKITQIFIFLFAAVVHKSIYIELLVCPSSNSPNHMRLTVTSAYIIYLIASSNYRIHNTLFVIFFLYWYTLDPS